MDHGFDDDLWLILDRYVAGEASAAEAECVRDWLACDTGRAEVLKELRRMREVLGQRPPARSVDAAWASAARQLGIEHSPPTPLAPQIAARRVKRISRRAPSWSSAHGLAAAAAIVIVAAGTVTLWQLQRSDETQTVAAPPPRVYATQLAQRADLNLSDGTRVQLNVGSRLIVPANYGQGSRDVTLEGEGYFDVVHDSTRPFVVRTSAGIAEDLGTSFVVAQYPETRGMKVSVTSGVVRVRRDSATENAATLSRGDLAHVDDSGRVVVRRGVNVEDEAAWTTGRLVFNRARLADVVPRLSRWFDADIRIGDSALNEVRYTASFRNQPVGQILELLAASLDAHVVRDPSVRNRYVLYPARGTR